MVGTVRDWLDEYQRGADPRALLTACLARLRCDMPRGAWIRLVTDDEFDAQLRALETMLADAPDRRSLLKTRPLFGVPFAVKDNIDIAEVPTTAACPAFTYVPARSAAAVERLRDAGAVWLGKTNLDQFATGLVGTRSPFGQPACVFSAEHISGGSSSGSAIVVALGDVAFALGTDTAGSGRVPAAFNQIVGMKPTPGRVSTRGVVPACRTLDCVSVFALTATDAGHVLSVIEGPDPEDPFSRFARGPASFPRTRLRIGVPSEPRLSRSGAYAAPYAEARDRAALLGHVVVPIDFDALHETAELLYAGPWVAERHAVVQPLLERAPEALEPTVRAVIGSAAKYSATDAFRAQYALRALQRKAAAIWRMVDLLLVPTAPMHPRFSEVAADPIGVNAALGVYSNFVNLLGWCAIALPAGRTANGLPFGVTAIAPAEHDAALVAFGCAWQQSLELPLGATAAAIDPRTVSMPMLRPAVRASLPIAVVGAHMTGMPLNAQLVERDARLLAATTTAPRYRLFALPGTTPPKPGLVRAKNGGLPIVLEVWDVPQEHIGSFLAAIPAPLGIGQVELADGSWVHGFLCEAAAAADALDISSHGGWRAWLDAQARIETAASAA